MRAAPVTRPPAAPARKRWYRRRVVALSAWLVAFIVGWVVIGLPTDPLYAFAWIWAATIALRIDRPWRSQLGFARDWAPIVVLLVAYNFSRGLAYRTGGEPHVRELIEADEIMFGWATGGQTPTVWLQQQLYDPDGIHWWDVLVSWTYFSHFVVAITVAAVLWVRNRPRWAAFMRRFFFLSATGLVTYFLYPAAPPWWAAEQGLVEEVARISTRGWHAIGLSGAGNLLNLGQLASNPVAAMPSLHTAFALLVVVFLIRSVRRRWWPLLLAYPLAMTFTLVYAGEHWVIDVLVGWAYVGFTFLVVGLLERWWAARGRGSPSRAEPVAAPAQSPAALAPVRSPAPPPGPPAPGG